ncbi:MAG: adenosylhomocysteinase, partial [Oscillospiraceae bacterium]|nr:adenosylhomocysteinase [Oscillospiraceae bacterium]
DQAAPLGDIFVTVTGCRDVIIERHLNAMKHNVILTNAGHFDVEVDVAWLRANAKKRLDRRRNIEGFVMEDGRVLNVLAEGRLVNLASGNGHPAEIMDMSFGVQALALKDLAERGRGLPVGVYEVPRDIDARVSAYKLAALGVTIDRLTPEQEEYLKGF